MENNTSNVSEALFETLYHRYFGKVFRFVLRHTRDEQDAEDLAHDVFLKFWKYRNSFSEQIPADAQLMVIAKQAIINRYRREVLKKEVIQQQESRVYTANDETEFFVREAEVSHEISKALACLPPKRRAIFEKSRFDTMTYEEIATDMGISKSTVEGQMVKALKFLRERLDHLRYLFLLFMAGM
jgi:RNA polymerase sigma-70 factor (family 1)